MLGSGIATFADLQSRKISLSTFQQNYFWGQYYKTFCCGYTTKQFYKNTVVSLNSGLYFKHIKIENDAYRVNSLTIVSEATTRSVTYDCNW